MYIGMIYLVSCAEYGLTKNTDYNDAAVDSDSVSILDTEIINDNVDTADTVDTLDTVDTQETSEPTETGDTGDGFVYEPYLETLAVGWYHYCGILSDNSMHCGGYYPPSSPSGSFEMVTGSNEFTYCGIKTNGYVSCWGTGNLPSAYETSSGGSIYSPPSDKFIDISAGDATACGVTEDSTIKCWGYSLYLGSAPTSAGWTQIAGGDGVWCALDSDDYAYCWVAPHYTEYHSGLTSPPTEKLSNITYGHKKFCGLTQDNNPICWGSEVNNSYFESVKNTVDTNISTHSLVGITGISSGVSYDLYGSEAPSGICIVYADNGSLPTNGQCFLTSPPVSETSSFYNQIVASSISDYVCSIMEDGSLECDFYTGYMDASCDYWSCDNSKPPGTFYTH